jgi:hypothetical protein
LFYEIIDYNNNKYCKTNDYSNHVLISDTVKNNYEDLDKVNDVEIFKKLAKLNTSRHNEAKNKYFFAIHYDETSKYMRIKPSSKVNVIIGADEKINNPFPIYYPIYPIDDVNIPIIASYYKIPTSTINDYMYTKITAHLFNSTNINKQLSENYSSVNKLINNTKPQMATIVKYLKDSFELDYNNLNNFLKRFEYQLDFITMEDFDILCDCMTNFTSAEKEREHLLKPLKIKRPDILNKKLTFFNKLQTTLKLLKLSDKNLDILTNLKTALEEQRMNSIEDNFEDDKKYTYLNIYDIISNVNDGIIDLNDAMNRIKKLKHLTMIEHSIKTINNLIELQNNIEEITDEHEIQRSDFEYASFHTFDYDKDGKNFVVFYQELQEIILGENEDNYEGVPAILKNNNYEDVFEDMENDVVNIDVIKERPSVRKNDLEKYWLNLKYKDEHGFIEYLKILIPLLDNLQIITCIEIDFDLLCDELFKYIRGVATKFNMLKNTIERAGTVLNTTVIYDISRINPNVSLVTDLNMGKEINNIIVNVNKEYCKELNKAFIISIAWWSLYIQEKILNNSININENELNSIYIDKWFSYGMPLQQKDKTGVLQYISQAMIDILQENNDYLLTENIVQDCMNIIEDIYKEKISILRDKYEIFKEKKKIERGVLAQRKMIENINNRKFDKIASDFIDALIYMPGVNYKKIHRFLNGCCLQKIDNDFKADMDLIKSNRKDIIDIKKKFSTRKETNKKRYIRYNPLSKDIETLEKIDDDTTFVNVEPYVYNINSDIDINIWLNKMYNRTPLLPNNIIDEIKENSRKCVEYIEQYLNILKTTSRNKNSDIDKLFVIGKINYKTLLLTITKILYENIKIYDDDNVKKIINLSIQSIKNIIGDLNKLNKVTNDDIKLDIQRISAFIVARCLCLPSSPESNVNMYIMNIMELPDNFIENNAKNIHNTILQSLKFSKFPTMEENIAFLNKKREENKQMKLSILNNKNVEENQLITNLKKAGIKHDLMNIDIEDNVLDKQNDDDIYQEEQDRDVSKGESDFKIGEEDYEDDDNMDNYDVGFIYSR